MIQKDVKSLLDSGLPLSQILVDLHTLPMRVPSREGLLPFARESLHVTPDQEDDWYRQAWWGYYASLLVRKRLRQGRLEEVMALVDPIDWGPLEDALGSGNGTLLVTAHVGLSRLCVACAEKSDYPVTRIHAGTSGPGKQQESILSVTTTEERKTSLVKSMTHLRRGGVLICAPDGRYGENYFLTRFLGQEVRMYSGLGELARITRSPTLWFTASWVDKDRIRINLEPLELHADTSADDWSRLWYNGYLARLGGQLQSKPADLGLKKGLWHTEKGGLDWYRKSDESKRVSRLDSIILYGRKCYRKLKSLVLTT